MTKEEDKEESITAVCAGSRQDSSTYSSCKTCIACESEKEEKSGKVRNNETNAKLMTEEEWKLEKQTILDRLIKTAGIKSTGAVASGFRQWYSSVSKERKELIFNEEILLPFLQNIVYCDMTPSINHSISRFFADIYGYDEDFIKRLLAFLKGLKKLTIPECKNELAPLCQFLILNRIIVEEEKEYLCNCSCMILRRKFRVFNKKKEMLENSMKNKEMELKKRKERLLKELAETEAELEKLEKLEKQSRNTNHKEYDRYLEKEIMNNKEELQCVDECIEYDENLIRERVLSIRRYEKKIKRNTELIEKKTGELSMLSTMRLDRNSSSMKKQIKELEDANEQYMREITRGKEECKVCEEVLAENMESVLKEKERLIRIYSLLSIISIQPSVALDFMKEIEERREEDLYNTAPIND